MKIQNIIRMQAIVIALGSALFLAGSLRAQEIDNVSFDEGPNSIPMGQAVPARAPKASTPAAANSPLPNVNTEAKTPINSEEVLDSRITPVDRWSMAALLVCIALGALYLRAMADSRTQTLRHRSARPADSKTALS
jgi:hypothetical protein